MPQIEEDEPPRGGNLHQGGERHAEEHAAGEDGHRDAILHRTEGGVLLVEGKEEHDRHVGKEVEHRGGQDEVAQAADLPDE